MSKYELCQEEEIYYCKKSIEMLYARLFTSVRKAYICYMLNVRGNHKSREYLNNTWWDSTPHVMLETSSCYLAITLEIMNSIIF